MKLNALAQSKIRQLLLEHQKRRKAGDSLPSISNVALRAGVHRDTIYALLSGDRINIRSQYALSRVMTEIQQETHGARKTRVMNLRFSGQGVQLGFGVSNFPLLRGRPVR